MIKRLAPQLSAAHVIAVVALVAAIGTGAAFGLPGKNSIDKNDIAKNAVKSKQVKNNGIKGVDVKAETLNGSDIADGSISAAEVSKDSLGGAEVNEASLDTVPSAGEAANAGTLGGLGPDAFERAGTVRTFQFRAAIGASAIDVFSAGPFQLVGSCLLSGAGGTQLVPTVTVATTENDSIAFAAQLSDPIVVNSDGDFDVGESLPFAVYQESSPASVLTAATGRMASPSGVSVTVDLTLASRVFSNNPSERVGCVFAGSAIVDPP